jgi:hypothetical protein
MSKATAYQSLTMGLTAHNASAHDALLLTDQDETQSEHGPDTRFLIRGSNMIARVFERACRLP